MIVAHAARRVTLVERDGEKGRVTDARGGETATIRSRDLHLGVDALYAVTDVR